MSTVKVQQASAIFQPVNIAVTLSSLEELTDFNKVLCQGLRIASENNTDSPAARNLANQLAPLFPSPAGK